MVNKIDSNKAGLWFAEEASIGTLPTTPDWYPLEPNSFSDFGGQISTVARDTINANRQRKKGVTTDLDASGGFNQDLTQNNLIRLFQGLFHASIREKTTTQPLNGTAIPITGVTAADDTYAAASGLASFAAGDLVFASDFTESANNGVHVVVSSSATTLVVEDGLSDETPSSSAKIQTVGFEMGSGELDVVVSGTYPKISRASGSVNFTSLGLIAGEWICIGGDATGDKFVNAANNCFARIRSISETEIDFDKTSATMVAETGTSLTIRLFFGNVLKNELAASIVDRSFQLERTLGEDSAGTMSEYIVGAMVNEATINVSQADKITVDLNFLGIDHEQRDGSTEVKSGNRPSLEDADAFNTSSDFSRIKMHVVSAGSPNPTALVGYFTELTLTVNNNLSPAKAIGTLGAFDVNVGQFQVGGSVSAYFSDISAVESVRNNSDVTIDCAIVKNNAGMIWDVPLISLGDGRLSVEKDQPIMIPLTMEAAECDNEYTLLLNEFPYLPDAAE